jgi:uncharacterized protein YjdB
MRKHAFCLILALSLVLTACPEVISVLFTSVTGITLNKTSITLTSGGKETLYATLEPANATTRTVIWTSSNISVAVVLDGVVTALIPGTAVITATTLDGGKKATCDVTVTSASVSGVTLNKSALSLFVGDSETLTAAITPADALIKTVIWTSSNPLVAVVSTSGLVTAFVPGTTTITARTLDGGKTASCVVTVSNSGSIVVPVAGVTLNKTSTRLAVGGTETLTAKITPSNATNQNVTWNSSNTAVATVSAGGTVTGISAGRAIITVTAMDGGEKASCSVNVSADSVAVTNVYLSAESISLFLNDIQILTARVEPDDATNQNVTWNSSDPSVAVVTGGLVMGVATGTAIISVTTEDGGKTSACSVTVSNIAVSGVSLNKTSAGLLVGSTETLYAAITPSNAINKSVTWSSSNTSIATVSGGLVTAVAPGTAIITVTTADGGKTATCAVTVSNVTVSGVTLNKSSASIYVGGTETLTETIAPADAANKSVTWSSGNSDVATVSTSGVVTGVSAGTVNITVTTEDGGKTATCAVTVSNVAVSGVSLKTSTGLLVGGTETLSAIIAPANATIKNVTWSSSNPSVATVYNDGVVTGLSAGTAVITVTTVDGGKTAACAVTVSNVTVTGVTLNKPSASLFVGNTETLIATIAPSNAANKNVTWSSNNTAVATVSDGVVTAVAAGSVTITVTTVDGGKTATCTVTVNSVAVTGVTLNKSSTSLLVGGNTETLTATIAPSNATNKNVTWSSSNPSIATVSNGVVTSVAVGTAVITVTADGGKTAACNVTVYTNTVAVSSVSLKTSASLTVGNTETLTAAINPSNATNQNVTWSSSNNSVATVSTGGVVTAVATGSAIITVTTADGGKTANCTVTVNAVNVTFNSVTANGSSTQTTTQLTLIFSQAIAGLSADNITLSGVTGVSKGTLSGSGSSYTLPISGFIAGGSLTVAVSGPSNYTINSSSRTVTIYYGTGTTSLTITFTQIADNAPNITGPTLYRVSNGGPTSATLTVDNPGQYDNISWRVQDTAVTGTGSSFTLSASNAAYNLIGEHFVTVSVMKGGVPYNKTVSFKIEY